MSHYAKVNNGIVEKVIVADADFFDTFVDDSPAEWIETSYNNTFRKNYAGIGATYNKDKDIFISPQPYNSWSLDGNSDWQPPVEYPTGGKQYVWNEINTSWDVSIPKGNYTWDEETTTWKEAN